MQVTDRLELLERTTQELTDRLARLEGVRTTWAPPAPERVVVPRPPAAPAPAPRPRPADVVVVTTVTAWRAAPPAAPPAQSLEDLLGGRVLAWAGGLAVLVAIVLFFAIAVSRDWIGEGARTALGGCAAFALLAAGARLQERRERLDAALAAASAGIAGLFATVVVAVRLYELVPAGPALPAALAVGAAAVALALRWSTPPIAALGIVGGLGAPVVLGAPAEPVTLALLWLAGAAAAAVLVHRGWDRVGAVASVVLAPQWVVALAGVPSPAEAVATLVAFGALAAVLAAAPVLRGDRRAATAVPRAETISVPAGLPRATLLLALNASLLGAAGWFALADGAGTAAGRGWLVLLAAAHLAAGAAVLARGRAGAGPDPGRRALGLAGLALGTVVADVAVAQLLDGVVLGLAWAGSSVAFAAVLGRMRAEGTESALVLAALTGHVLLAIGHALSVTAPLELLDATAPALGEAGPGLAGLAAGLFASGALVTGRPEGRLALHALGVATVTYLLALALDGPALAAAYAVEAVLLAPVSVPAAAALTVATLTHALAFDAPPAALETGLADPVGALVALGATAAAATATAAGARDRAVRTAAGAVAALAVLFLASTALVTAVGPGEQAQAALSALWALTGVGALVAGLLGDLAPLRAGALALLLGTLGKVFLYDLATLDAMARVASFLVLGLLLLLAAFAWQRIRPRPCAATS